MYGWLRNGVRAGDAWIGFEREKSLGMLGVALKGGEAYGVRDGIETY